jgi:hypothetical protein
VSSCCAWRRPQSSHRHPPPRPEPTPSSPQRSHQRYT